MQEAFRRGKAAQSSLMVTAFDEEGICELKGIPRPGGGCWVQNPGRGIRPPLVIVGTGNNNYAVDFIRATRFRGFFDVVFCFLGNEAVQRAFHSAFLHHACSVGMVLAS